MAHRKAGSDLPFPCRYHQRAALRTTSGFVGGSVLAIARVSDPISSGTSKTFETLEGAEPVDLRKKVRDDIERAAVNSPLRFGAADVRLTADRHAVLEVNPSPRFAHHEEHGTTDITDRLADRLVG